LAAHEAKIEANRKETARIAKAENDKLTAEARSRAGAYLMAAHDVARSQRIRLQPAAPESHGIVRESGSFENGNVNRPLEKKKGNVAKDTKAPFFAEYKIQIEKAGEFQLDLFDEEKGAGTANILINGQLMKRGAPPVQNREASPDAGGWSAAGVFGSRDAALEWRGAYAAFRRRLPAAPVRRRRASSR
jgi:hypothetical protein